MPDTNLISAGESVEYRVVDELFPIEELEISVHQRRDAELALNEVNGDSVIAVSPTSLATGYFLGQHPLTAIQIDDLPQMVSSAVNDSLDRRIKIFDFIQIGTLSTPLTNHSLTEYMEETDS